MSKRKIVSSEDPSLTRQRIGDLDYAVQRHRREMLELEVQQQINALDYILRKFQAFHSTILNAQSLLQTNIATELGTIIDFLYSQFPGTAQVKLDRLAMIAILKGEGLPSRPVLPSYAENPLYTNSYFSNLILRQYNKSLFAVNLEALIIFSDIFSISTLAMCKYWTRPETIQIIQSQKPSGTLTVFLRSLVKSHEIYLHVNIKNLLKSVCEIWVGYETFHTQLYSEVQEKISWSRFLQRMKQLHRFADYGENAETLEHELYHYLKNTLTDQVLTLNHVKIFIETILMPHFQNFPSESFLFRTCNSAPEKFLLTKLAIFVTYMDYMPFGLQYATCITKNQGGGYFTIIFRVMVGQNPQLCEYRTGFWNLPEENSQDSSSDDSSDGDSSSDY